MPCFFLLFGLFFYTFISSYTHYIISLFCMKGRSLYEMYFQPIRFRTIGFTQEGLYSIGCSLVYGSINQPKKFSLAEHYSISRPLANSRNPPSITSENTIYETQKFLVTHNNQIDQFSSSCLFKTQMECTKDQNLSLIIQLYKWQYEKEKEDANESLKRIHEVVQQNWQDTLKNQASVDKIVININLNEFDSLQPTSLYKKYNFTSKKYYSTFIFCFFHATITHKLRIHTHNLLSFKKLKESSRNLLLKQKQIISKKLQISSLDLLRLFRAQSYEQLYKTLISKQIMQWVKLQILRDVIMRQNQIEGNRQSPKMSPRTSPRMRRRSSRKIIIIQHNLQELEEKYLDCFYDLAKFGPINKQILMKWYELNQDSQLIFTLYSETQILAEHILHSWREVLQLIYTKEKKEGLEEETNIENLKIMTKLEKYYTVKQDNFPFPRPVEQISEFIKSLGKYIPSIFSQIPFISIKREGNPEIPLKYPHTSVLFILAHGLKGSDGDMNHLKNHIQNYRTVNTEFLVLKNIKYDDEDQSLEELGRKAAEQIDTHIRTTCYQLDRINMIGFSMGGLVLRAALKHLEQYQELMNVYISLSTPHLGMIPTENCLVNFGLFCLRRLKRLRAVDQICKHSDEPYSQFMRDLPKGGQMSWFQFIVVVGSRRDSYIKNQSSILSYEGNDEEIISLQKKVIQNVNSLHRIQVDPQSNEQSLIDQCFGKNHTYFIIDDPFLCLLVSMYMEYF